MAVTSVGSLLVGAILLLSGASGSSFDIYAGFVLVLIVFRLFVFWPRERIVIAALSRIMPAPILVWIDVWAFLFSIVIMDITTAASSTGDIRTQLIWSGIVIAVIAALPIANILIYSLSKNRKPKA